MLKDLISSRVFDLKRLANVKHIQSSKRTTVPRYLGPMPNSGTLVLCQTVNTILYCTVLYCTVQYLYSTVQYSTVVDRHGDQGRHVLRHVRGGRIGALPSQGGNLN